MVLNEDDAIDLDKSTIGIEQTLAQSGKRVDIVVGYKSGEKTILQVKTQLRVTKDEAGIFIQKPDTTDA
jgi:hypothetical protein